MKVSLKTAKNRVQQGAAMVEAAMVTIIFLVLIGGFTYLFFRFYLYQAMLDGLTSSLRKASVEANEDFEDYEAITTSKVVEELDKYNLGRYLNVTPVVRTCWDPGSNRCMVTGFITWSVPCPLCALVPMPNSATVKAAIAIEDPCFDANRCAAVQAAGDRICN